MNHPAQRAPEGATDIELDGLIRQMMTAPPHTESVSQHARTILRARLVVESAALRARCERLEGALRQTIDRCARVELGAPSYHLANDLATVLRAALAQPEDDK